MTVHSSPIVISSGDMPVWAVRTLHFIETLSREISCHTSVRNFSAPAGEESYGRRKSKAIPIIPHRKKPLLSRGLFPVKLSIPSAGRYGFFYPRKAMDSFH